MQPGDVDCRFEMRSTYNETLNMMVDTEICRYRLCYEGGLNCEAMADVDGDRRCRLRGKCDNNFEQCHGECCLEEGEVL